MLDCKDGKLVFRYDAEEVWIEAWGQNALRVRATKEDKMPEEDWALYHRGNAVGEITFTERGRGSRMGRFTPRLHIWVKL